MTASWVIYNEVVQFNRKIFLFIIFLFLVLTYVGIGIYAANRVTAAVASRIDTSPKFVADNVEDITLSSRDGTKLSGWFFKGKSNKAIIFVAGLTQNRVDNGYFALFIAHDLYMEGYSILLYDSRGEGQSDPVRLGFGSSSDGDDILSALDFLKSRGFDSHKVGIIGDSAGAIAVIQNADRLTDVGALIVDSPAARFEPVVANILEHDYGVHKIFDPGIFFFAQKLYGVDIKSINPIDSIKKVPERKFLFLHGSKDDVIPVDDSKKLFESANKGSRLVIFNSAYHVETYKSDPNLYRKEVFGFLEAELK